MRNQCLGAETLPKGGARAVWPLKSHQRQMDGEGRTLCCRPIIWSKERRASKQRRRDRAGGWTESKQWSRSGVLGVGGVNIMYRCTSCQLTTGRLASR